MLHRSGRFDQESLIKALQGYLPYSGENMQSYDVQYIDDEIGEVMVANFIWVNNQWVYLDSRKQE